MTAALTRGAVMPFRTEGNVHLRVLDNPAPGVADVEFLGDPGAIYRVTHHDASGWQLITKRRDA